MTVSEQQQALRKQLEAHGITDDRVLDVIERTHRDRFVPDELRDHAYDDSALPIGAGQTISQPYIVALMTQSLELEGDERVLEIGTGSGYQAAILAQLCAEVVTIERLPELSETARKILAEEGFTNIRFRDGDGTLGWPEFAPYDGILVTAAAPAVPEPLFEQLKPGGRMIIPVGDEDSQRLLCIEKQANGDAWSRELCGCRFVKLIGESGWPTG